MVWVLNKGATHITPPKFILNVNKLTQTVEHNEAFFRRIIVINFNQTIPAEKRDPKLAAKIIDKELPGIFNWILEGMIRIVKNERFSSSEAIDKAIESYKRDTDVVKQFLIDRYVRTFIEIEKIEGTGHDNTIGNDGGTYPPFTKLKDLYNDFKTWWHINGGATRPMKRKTFKERMFKAYAPTDIAREKMEMVEYRPQANTETFYVTKCNCREDSGDKNAKCFHS